MTELLEATNRRFQRLVRGPAACRLLERMGIDSRRYWLLVDLFGELSERREVMSHLGNNTQALRMNSWILFGMTGLLTAAMLFANAGLRVYFSVFLGMTGFLMLGMLFSEAGNSLVNPAEGLVLAHQPINGATYTAAKLTHLLRILVYLVPALNGIPAVCGPLLGAPWYYPLLHLGAAFALGVVIALFCCAMFGWLIRFIPARRLKAAGQIAEVAPWTLILLFQNGRRLFKNVHIPNFLPTATGPRVGLAVAVAGVCICVVVMGLRCLSGDYLVRISAIVHGTPRTRGKVRRSRTSDLVARVFGGPASRAGFEFVSRMMRRDWQFRRQLIPMIPGIVGIGALAAHDFRTSPFLGKFTGAHVLPHLFGVILFWICPLLVFGSDYKGTWMFLLAPARLYGAFARGVYAWLWLRIVVVPHMAIAAVGAALWGPRDAALFTAYSLAVGSFYLSMELRLIDGMPFSRQPQPSRQNYLVPIMMMGGAAIAVVVGLQYFLLFRSRAAVMAATALVAVGAYYVTRNSLETFETNIRYDLGMLTTESKGLYTEIDA